MVWWSAIILFSLLFDCFNVKSLTNFLFYLFWPGKWARFQFWRKRSIRSTEVLWVFPKIIRVCVIGAERIDIVISSIINVGELQRWRKFCKLNLDPAWSVSDCTTTDWNKRGRLKTWNIQGIYCRLSGAKHKMSSSFDISKKYLRYTKHLWMKTRGILEGIRISGAFTR